MCPAVEGGSQERKDRRLHIDVLETQIFLNQIGPMAEPRFKLTGGFDYVHGARNDSEVAGVKSTPGIGDLRSS